MASTVPATKAAIRAAIQARPAITAAGIPVLWGAPTADRDWAGATEAIWLGDATQTEEWPGLGARRDEDYTIQIGIRVTGYGADQEQATEERAWELRDEIAAGVATVRPTHMPGEIEATTQRNVPSDDGWWTDLTLTVRVRAITVQS
jgi:hypothetical protein